MSGVQVANEQFLGGDSRPYVTIDGLPFPLVPGSQVEVSPLNPFSPSNADGNTTAVLSQRHATQVWDDFTGGVGYLDDDPDAHQYAYGNLDTRVPRAVVPPHKANGVASGAAAALPYSVAGPTSLRRPHVEYIGDDAGPGFLTWRFGWDLVGAVTGVVRRVNGGVVSTVGIPDAEGVWGVARWNGSWYVVTTTGAGNTNTYKSTGNSQTLAFTVVNTVAGGRSVGLVAYDNKLICFDPVANQFHQWSTATNSWVAYIDGFVPLTGSVNGDGLLQLFVWTDKSGSTDALYMLTWQRLMVYDDAGQQWETLYTIGDLFASYEAQAHVSRRDNALLAAMTPALVTGAPAVLSTGTILTFTPGTVDNIPLNKGFGYPANATYQASFGALAPVNHVVGLSSGIHWVYAWCYAPTGLGAGLQGGVFAYNEFGGWVQIFDPCAARNNTTASVIGGGYGGGYLLTILSDGSYYIQNEYDMNLLPPYGTYDDASAGNHDYFIQSGRVWNRQRNVLKLGSHLEFTFQDPIPANNTCYAEYRYYNENGLSAWQQSANFPTGKKRISVDLKAGGASGGINYYYMEWRFHSMMLAGATAPAVLQFVVLNYTYWQDNHNSYQFAIDLTRETWAEYYPDGGMPAPGGGLYQREGLQQYILQTLVSAKTYHTFTYNWTNSNFQEVVARADLLISRRESADDLSGVYLCTVRDLEPDTPAAGSGQHGVA